MNKQTTKTNDVAIYSELHNDFVRIDILVSNRIDVER
jgi:hypothetical protein